MDRLRERPPTHHGGCLLRDGGDRWARTIAALDQITSSDDALDDGQSILNAVMVQAQSEHLHLIYQSCTQRVSQGWIEGEIVIRALHRLALR